MTKSKRATNLQAIKALADNQDINRIIEYLRISADDQADMIGTDDLEEQLVGCVNPSYDYQPEFDQYEWQIEDIPNMPHITEDMKPVLRQLMDMTMIRILNDREISDLAQ